MANFENIKNLHRSNNVNDEFVVLENNFGICQSSVIDKKRLFKAVSTLKKNVVEVNFAFGEQLLLPGRITLNPFKVDKLGEILIPVSVKDIQRLKEVSSPSCYGKGYNKLLDFSKRLALEIDASKLTSTFATNLSLPSMVMHHLDLPSELMNVQAKLDRLILYEAGGHYQHILESEKDYGSFGTIILQLPVEGGHEGGRFKVEYRGSEQVYENSKDSDRFCYVSSFYGNSKHSMEPITRGTKLTLIFDLVWENAETIIPQDFAVFLTALKKIKESLPSWISADRIADSQNTLSNAACTQSFLLNAEEKDRDQEEVREEDLKEDLDEDQEQDEDKHQEDLLYFVLEEEYDENDFGFRRLRGKDKDLAQIFQYCVFLEKHIAVISQTVLTTNRKLRGERHSRNWCNCQPYERVKSSTKISRWVDSEGMSRKLSIGINWKKQCVGPRRNLPTSDFEVTDEEEVSGYIEEECHVCETTTSEECIKHFILVIWPKHQTFRLYCRYGLRSLLESIEVKSSSRWLKENAQKAIEDLRKLISFCCSDPQNMWNQTQSRKGELTERLLRLCVDLRAREEGLALLKILGAQFRMPQERTSNLQEGIETKQVAKMIAEFECRVTGWNDCADLIKQIVSTNRIFQQLLPTIKLAQFFLDSHCLEGAKLVGTCISSLFMNINRTQALSLKKKEIQAYIELIISLEENAETSHRERLTSFVSLFSKLESLTQCSLVLELEAQASLQFKDLESCKIMFHDLCEALTACDLRSTSIKEKVMVDLICCYFRIGNAKWLQSFTSNIFYAQVTSEKNIFHSSDSTFNKITSSPVIMKLALSSDLGEAFITSIVDNQLTSLEKRQFSFHEYEAKMSTCFRFFIQMGKNYDLLNAQRSSSISSLLGKLNVHQLICILTDVLKSSPGGVKRCSSAVTIIRHICNSLISRLKENTTVVLRRQVILDGIEVFIQLGDASFTQTVVKQICANEETGTRGHKMKYDLFVDLLNRFPGEWKKLDAKSKLIILNTCGSLIQAWVMDICRSINEPTASIQTSTKLNESIFSCVQLYFLAEKNRSELEQNTTAQVFQQLIPRLKDSLLLELVLKLHQSEVALRPNIKKFPACMDWYRGICRLLFTMDYVSLVNFEVASKIVRCLLWLEDEQSWQSFTLSVCNTFPSSHSHFFVRIFLKDVSIQRALQDSSLGLNALERIVDKRTEQLASLEEPQFSWRQPKATVANHPEVETFLRSSLEVMTYKKFTGIVEARRFAENLQDMGGSNNFSVSVAPFGSGKHSRCIITKNRNHFKQTMKDFFSTKADLMELVKLCERLVQENVKAKPLSRPIYSEPITEEEVCIVPPPKRAKLNKPVVKLE